MPKCLSKLWVEYGVNYGVERWVEIAQPSNEINHLKKINKYDTIKIFGTQKLLNQSELVTGTYYSRLM